VVEGVAVPAYVGGAQGVPDVADVPDVQLAGEGV